MSHSQATAELEANQWAGRTRTWVQHQSIREKHPGAGLLASRKENQVERSRGRTRKQQRLTAFANVTITENKPPNPSRHPCLEFSLPR